MDAVYNFFRAPGIKGKVLKSWSNSAFDPISLLHLPDDPQFNCKRGNTVQAAVNGRCFVKRINLRPRWAAFRHYFKRSRPELSLLAAEKLKKIGVETPQVLAVFRQYKNFMPRFDCLITEDIGANVVFADKLPPTEQLAVELCALLVNMHNHGIEHGDVNLRNLYRCKNTGKMGVIDLDGCRLSSRPVSPARRARELARLASAFIKRRNNTAEGDSLPENIADFLAQHYKNLSGTNPDTPGYRRRVAYLSQRKRK